MNRSKKYLLLLLSVIYSIIFWKEKLGLNIFLFTPLLIILLLRMNPGAWLSKPVKITLAGTILSGCMVLLFNSDVSKFAHIASFFVMLGFIHQSNLKSIAFGLQHSIYNYLHMPAAVVKDISGTDTKKLSRAGMIGYYLKLSAIPLSIALLFYILFLFANPVFARLSSSFWEHVFNFIGNIFEYISFLRLLFTFSGIIVIGGIVYNTYIREISEKESSLQDVLTRIRKKRTDRVFFSVNALKNEYNAAIILIALVNILLLIVNCIDITHYWFNFTIPDEYDLKHFVHEGTYFLIASILLSIVIILYFFRKNINFYTKNSLLKTLAYIWMCQNIVLAFSVCLRNYHYIDIHGMAYKRIGVMLFLILTIAGLVTMLIKISKIKSSFYVIKQNTWAAYIMMIFMSCINWDIVMVSFNLNHWNKAGIDTDFYFTLSPKVMPYLYHSLPAIESQIQAKEATGHSPAYPINDFKEKLNAQKTEYLLQQSQYSWLSWNLSDYQTVSHLTSF